MTGLDRGAGPNSAHSCQDHCPMPPGRLKGTHYYPPLLRPDNCDDERNNHDDIDPAVVAQHQPSQVVYLREITRLLRAPTKSDYEDVRLATGLSRPSLFLAFPDECRLPIPNIWVLDNMHVGAINTEDLFGRAIGKSAATWPESYPGQRWPALASEPPHPENAGSQ
jgi:hypothetical protein